MLSSKSFRTILVCAERVRAGANRRDGSAARRLAPLLLCAFAIALAAGAAHPAVLHVPAPYPTPQLALNAASSGDTVLVAPGTYVDNILWPNRGGITLLSEEGAEATILDGDHRETVIGLYYASIDTTTLIRGFTLRNGAVEGM